MKIDLSRPDIVYAVIWGLAYLLLSLTQIETTSTFSPEITWMVLSNVASFFVIYRLMDYALSPARQTRKAVFTKVDLHLLKSFGVVLFWIWTASYVVNIIFAGGLPIYWQLTGDARTYLDFGLPTFTGISNMIRAFLFSIFMYIFVKNRDRGALLLALILVASSLLEGSRGALALILLHGMGIYALSKKFALRNFIFLLLGLAGFVLLFGLIADYRGGHTSIEDLVGEDSIFLQLPDGFFWVYIYITTPLNNMNYAYNFGIEPLYYPYFSVASLLPSIIRDSFFSPTEYPIQLVTDAFNATSFYAPLLADYGLVGAGLAVAMLQLIVSYVHVKAVKGSRFHFLIYPVLYMCVILSIFYMYFLSLVTVMYPILAYFYEQYRASKLQALNNCKSVFPPSHQIRSAN